MTPKTATIAIPATIAEITFPVLIDSVARTGPHIFSVDNVAPRWVIGCDSRPGGGADKARRFPDAPDSWSTITASPATAAWAAACMASGRVLQVTITITALPSQDDRPPAAGNADPMHGERMDSADLGKTDSAPGRTE